MAVTDTDITMMQRALELARRGIGSVSPNPLVGCVITDESGNIIGKGWHEKYGEAHAEVNAVRNAESNGHSVKNSTVYVTLEPCSHHAKTPPCADLLIEKQIARSVIAMQDPYREVNGLGIKKLRDAGIEVTIGVLEDEAKELNKFFIKHVTTGLPYLTMKVAMSLDGKVGLRTGASKYITSDASRTIVHQMRAQYDAVMVASATVIADDPELTVRLASGRQPKRIILDASLRIPEDKKVFSDGWRSSTVVIANESILSQKKEKTKELESRGVSIIPIRSATEQLDLKTVFMELSKQHIASILIEPGPTLATSLLHNSLIDEVVLFYAPFVLGNDAHSAFGELHLRSLADAARFRLAESGRVEGSDDFYVNLRKN